MIALAVYQRLSEDARTAIARRVLERQGVAFGVNDPADDAGPLELEDALGGDYDHSALRAELTEWWHQRATTREIVSMIDAENERARELAIVLCAESVGHLADDSRVAECRHVRLAWVRGEAADEQRQVARHAAWGSKSGVIVPAFEQDPVGYIRITSASRAAGSHAAIYYASDAARDAAWAAASDAARDIASYAAWAAARDAVWDAAYNALATPLRTLYPDPCVIKAGVGLANWDVAVAEAHKALRQAVMR